MKLCPTCQRCYEDTDVECVQENHHDPLVAARLGERLIAEKYLLETLIARGGMGAVYAGTHVDLDRPVAVKLLQPDLYVDPASFERFRREARVAAKIKHPNIADIYDYGSLGDGESYIVMELVEGQTLLDRIRQVGQFQFAEAIMLSRQIAEGMEAAHHSGIIHRDLKPSNIVLTRNFDGSVLVKIIDFGIAKISEQLSPDEATLTATGTLVGTPRYMSPEQCLGHELDSRTDIYSFGVILYEMLAGQPPFDATSAIAIALKHVQELPPPLELFRANVLSELLNLINSLLSTEPAGRPQSATELKQRLAELENSIGSYEAEETSYVTSLPDGKDYSTQVNVEVEKVREATSDPYETEVIAPEPVKPSVPSSPAFFKTEKTIRRAVPLRTEIIAPNAVSENTTPSGIEDEATRIARKPRRQTRYGLTVTAVVMLVLAIGGWIAARRGNPFGSRATSSPSAESVSRPAQDSSRPADEKAGSTNREAKDQQAGEATLIEKVSDENFEQARTEITDSINGWVAAINEGDVNRQMAFYPPTVEVFYRTRNVSSAAIRAEKERLFEQADKIDVQVGEPQFEFSDHGQTGTTRFRKRYQIEGPQGNRRGEVVQELRWEKTSEGWRITSERDVRVIRNSGEARRTDNPLKSPHQLVLKGVKKLIQPFH